QFAFELVEETPIGVLCDKLLRGVLDHPQLAHPQRMPTNRVFGIVLPPLAVRNLPQPLQNVVIMPVIAPWHVSFRNQPGDTLRLERAQIGCLKYGPERALRRDWVLADE